MDTFNNLPLTVKGPTTTHPDINYDGKEEFLVSAGIYPGSSGSPVFILDENYYKKSRELHTGRDMMKLIGVVYARFEYSMEGKIFKSNPVDQILNASGITRSIISKVL